VRWLDSGETTVEDTTFLWSGRKDSRHQEGVALAIHQKTLSACVSWTLLLAVAVPIHFLPLPPVPADSMVGVVITHS